MDLALILKPDFSKAIKWFLGGSLPTLAPCITYTTIAYIYISRIWSSQRYHYNRSEGMEQLLKDVYMNHIYNHCINTTHIRSFQRGGTIIMNGIKSQGTEQLLKNVSIDCEVCRTLGWLQRIRYRHILSSISWLAAFNVSPRCEKIQ